ncbi:hypothetical protein GETHLI_25800 [Geothrix limicola]|uniref:NolW-like domain-containing protein n=1 Tax=Geothrix limicola TaxID=2927978 RepID=A0ABQ5QHA6_9BACT|nr:secretin N-terminal domain-containing protein [Geothrix limicola]GLH74078.1 hypothetical protein GETHLI_25800 [Geothrix limicola]
MMILRSLALSALLVPTLGAQTSPAAPAPQARPAEPDLTTLRAMKSKVFMVQHRDPNVLVRALRALGSGVNGSTLNYTNDGGINTLSARDFPENLAAIEEALKRLDVPATTQRTAAVELTLHVLFATKGPITDAGLPADLQDVVKQLKSTLAYRGYTLAASFVQRVQIQDNERSETGGLGHVPPSVLGSVGDKDMSSLKVEWSARGLRLETPSEGPTTLFMGSFRLDLVEEMVNVAGTLAKFNTPLSLREGEKVVVGTSVVKDHGVVVVLTSKRVN